LAKGKPFLNNSVLSKRKKFFLRKLSRSSLPSLRLRGPFFSRLPFKKWQKEFVLFLSQRLRLFSRRRIVRAVAKTFFDIQRRRTAYASLSAKTQGISSRPLSAVKRVSFTFVFGTLVSSVVVDFFKLSFRFWEVTFFF